MARVVLNIIPAPDALQCTCGWWRRRRRRLRHSQPPSRPTAFFRPAKAPSTPQSASRFFSFFFFLRLGVLCAGLGATNNNGKRKDGKLTPIFDGFPFLAVAAHRRPPSLARSYCPRFFHSIEATWSFHPDQSCDSICSTTTRLSPYRILGDEIQIPIYATIPPSYTVHQGHSLSGMVAKGVV